MFENSKEVFKKRIPWVLGINLLFATPAIAQETKPHVDNTLRLSNPTQAIVKPELKKPSNLNKLVIPKGRKLSNEELIKITGVEPNKPSSQLVDPRRIFPKSSPR